MPRRRRRAPPHRAPPPPPPPRSPRTQVLLGARVVLDPSGVGLPVGRRERELGGAQQHRRRPTARHLRARAMGRAAGSGRGRRAGVGPPLCAPAGSGPFPPVRCRTRLAGSLHSLPTPPHRLRVARRAHLLDGGRHRGVGGVNVVKHKAHALDRRVKRVAGCLGGGAVKERAASAGARAPRALASPPKAACCLQRAHRSHSAPPARLRSSQSLRSPAPPWAHQQRLAPHVVALQHQQPRALYHRRVRLRRQQPLHDRVGAVLDWKLAPLVARRLEGVRPEGGDLRARAGGQRVRE
jgi:hypothetical protein